MKPLPVYTFGRTVNVGEVCIICDAGNGFVSAGAEEDALRLQKVLWKARKRRTFRIRLNRLNRFISANLVR